MPNKTAKLSLIFLFIISVLTIFLTRPNDSYTPILRSLATGFFVSFIFYIVVIYLPENKKRKIAIRSLEAQFKSFKLSCIVTFLILSKSQNYGNKEMLLDLEEFRRYFSNVNQERQTRWDLVASGLNENEYYIKLLIHELRMLNEEIRFYRSSANIYDEEVFAFFNNFSQILFKMETTEPEYDDINSFLGILWSIFTGWSFIDGYNNSDIFLKMMSKLKKT